MSLSIQHPVKDNIVTIIEENTTPEEDEFYEYPYYIARIQRQFINTKNDGLKHNTPIIDLYWRNWTMRIVSIHSIGLKRKGL